MFLEMEKYRHIYRHFVSVTPVFWGNIRGGYHAYAEILKHKAAGLSLQQIADALQADGIATMRGASWKKGTVDGLLRKWKAQGIAGT
jgi:hypothetical protein